MNRKILALFLAVVLILTMTACKTVSTSGTDATEATVVPGVVILDKPVQNPFETEGVEVTEPDGTGNNTVSENNGNGNNNSTQGNTSDSGKGESTDVTTAPTTGKNEGTAGTSAPTTGKNEGTEDTTPPTTAGKDESTEGTTAGTTGKNESPETTTPPSTDKEEAPDETTPPATDKEEEPIVTTPPTEVPTEPEEGDTVTAYEWYLSLSGPEQQAFFASFANPAEFFAWLNNAKAEYEALHPDVEIGDGNVDLGGGN